MSACSVPAPGSKLGPCLEPCEHSDCKANRADAGKECRYCGLPIGYETMYYADGPEGARFSQLVHQLCELKAIKHEERSAKP